ncbi:MAG: SCP2 sterol-binding domain-containing protein [Acidimicrobiales bacterium]
MVEPDASAAPRAPHAAAPGAHRAGSTPVGGDLAGWVDEAGRCYPLLPDAPGANGTVTFAVALAPRREASIFWTYRDGKPCEGGAGSPPGSDLTLSVDASDAGKIFSGLLQPSVAFMRGRLKASGDDALTLAFLRSTVDPGFSRWLRKVGELVSVERSA